MADKRDFCKPILKPGTGVVPGRDSANNTLSGISALHVNAARELVRLHTRGRNPIQQGSSSISNSTASTSIQSTGQETSSVSPFQPSKSVSVPALAHEGECMNPQCGHCGLVIIPSPKAFYPIQDKPSITINDWSIFVIKKPILNSAELDALAESKFTFPLPEMIFGNNSIKLVNDKEGICIEFNTLDALEGLDESCNFKVSYHKEWLDSRRSSEDSISTTSGSGSEKNLTPTNTITSNIQSNTNTKDLKKLTDLESLKPYDWTYSTKYQGSITHLDPKFLKPSQTAKIPIERLVRPDPILFFDEMVLFEDELGDNGISMLSVKVRVMPTCLLLLSRFFLRIDNVAFRVRDTRIFIDLETSEIIREYKEQESPYDVLLRKVTGGSNSKIVDPKGLLRDTNWVSQNIPVLWSQVETNKIG